MIQAFGHDTLSATFAALADPTRRSILTRLMDGPVSVKELAAPFDMTAPAISKHLKVLENAGLITRGREAQRRPCRLEAAPLREVRDWTARYKQFFEESFDRLDAYLVELQAKEKRANRTAAAASPKPGNGAAKKSRRKGSRA